MIGRGGRREITKRRTKERMRGVVVGGERQLREEEKRGCERPWWEDKGNIRKVKRDERREEERGIVT